MESVTGNDENAVPPVLTEEDYYFEGGLMVFTAAYHLKRGYCCGSGCRHCPYREGSAADASEGPGRAQE